MPGISLALLAVSVASAAGAIVRVLGVELVPVLAELFPGVLGGQAYAAQNILSVGHRLEVIRVHALPVATEVVDVKALGDGSDQKLIGEPVGVS